MKNEYQVTWKRYKTWIFENMLKGIQLYFMIYWSVFSILTLGFGVVTGYYLVFLLTAFCVYRAFFRSLLIGRRQYKMMAERYQEENWIRSILFGEEKITLSEKNLTMDYSYSDIKGIREKDERLYLDLRDKTVIRLYKSAFMNGSWEQCREMIERKKNENAENAT